MSRVVVDCSVTIAWCLDEEASHEAYPLLLAIAEEGAVVPANWPFEVANVLAVSERQNRLTSLESTRFLGMIRKLPIDIEEAKSAHVFAETLAIARTHRLTAYDAAYLELAIRLALPLATLDKALRTVARKLGVQELKPRGRLEPSK